MSITSLVFILFVFMTMTVYYLIPKKIKKYQWVVLLIASVVFYGLSSPWGIIFVLITSLSIYFSALLIDNVRLKGKLFIKENKDSLSKEDKKAYKENNKKIRKRIMISAIVLNIGILCFFKYSHFAVEQINAIASLFGNHGLNNNYELISVLGISFYTFQSVGYLVDVYWETDEVQKNYAKMLLFVSFFPQVTQGPISDYNQLSAELFKEHYFEYDNYARGFQRMLWGFFKKMVIADYLAPFINDAFENYSEYTGITCLLAAFGYSIQIYADFSGYMDIMCGLCEMFGITLAENFERPYFSKSVAEYWRRWHITLGAWFKKYIYYPIGVSKWNRNLGKKCERFGKTVSENLPATVALVVVWFVTGLWHGASWAYIAWGGVNGLFIIFSMWAEPAYSRIKKSLHIKEGNFFWKTFQIIRTFVLVTFIKVLPEVGTLSDGIGFWKRIFTNRTIPSDFRMLIPYLERGERLFFFFLVLCIIILFVVSVFQRRGQVRDVIKKIPIQAQIILFSLLTIAIFSIGISASIEGSFMYAKF